MRSFEHKGHTYYDGDQIICKRGASWHPAAVSITSGNTVIIHQDILDGAPIGKRYGFNYAWSTGPNGMYIGTEYSIRDIKPNNESYEIF